MKTIRLLTLSLLSLCMGGAAEDVTVDQLPPITGAAVDKTLDKIFLRDASIPGNAGALRSMPIGDIVNIPGLFGNGVGTTLAKPLGTSGSIIANGTLAHVLSAALGDGTTDARPAVQAKIDEVVALGGGTIVFPSGTYRLTKAPATNYCLKIPSNIVLAGQGISTRLACDDATATTLLFAAAEGPYNASTPLVDHCEVRDMWINPLVQKADAAMEVYVPYSRRFVIKNIQFGRNGPMVSGATAVIESKIGTAIKLGDSLALGSSNAIVSDIRGFGFYSILWLNNTVDAAITNLLADADRSIVRSFTMSGAVEGCMTTNVGLVNSKGLGFGADGPTLLMVADSGTPRFNFFSNCFFDTAGHACEIINGHANTFSGCWFSGKFGITNRADAIGNKFQSCRITATLFEAVSDYGSSNSLEDCEAVGGFQSTSILERAVVRIAATAKNSVIKNFNCLQSLYAGRISSSNSYKDILIESGARNSQVSGLVSDLGVCDLSQSAALVPKTGLSFWGRADLIPRTSSGNLSSVFSNSANGTDRVSFGSAGAGYENLTYHESACGGLPALGWKVNSSASSRLRIKNSEGADSAIVLIDFSVMMLVKTKGDGVILGNEGNEQFRIGADNILSGYFGAVQYYCTVALPTREWGLVEMRRAGTTLEFYHNGLKLGETITGVNTSAFSINCLGGVLASQLQPRGFVSEILIYSTASDSPRRAGVMHYLNLKYPTLELGW